LNEAFVIGDPRVFIGVTLVLGGLASVASGRAVALTWRPLWLLALYALPLAFAMRFLQWSLFGEPLTAPGAALLAYGWSLAVQGLAWRLVHGALVRRQYPWLKRT
jgi:branched-chain amino acid transport system ATP-binding protein